MIYNNTENFAPYSNSIRLSQNELLSIDSRSGVARLQFHLPRAIPFIMQITHSNRLQKRRSQMKPRRSISNIILCAFYCVCVLVLKKCKCTAPDTLHADRSRMFTQIESDNWILISERKVKRADYTWACSCIVCV